MSVRAYLIKTMCRRRRVGWFFAGAVFGGFAAGVVSILPTDLVGTSGQGGVVFTAVLAAVISAYAFWRATRFRIAREAAEVGGSLALTAPRWSVTLQPGDVRQVLQLRSDPYGFGFFAKQPYRAWRAWLRMDVSTKKRRVRSYLVWRPDAPGLPRTASAGWLSGSWGRGMGSVTVVALLAAAVVSVVAYRSGSPCPDASVAHLSNKALQPEPQ